MVCQNCGKELVRGYSFCMECGTPVPPEALEEAGMPPRTGDHAENPREKSPARKSDSTGTAPSSGMPDISPLSAGNNDDSSGHNTDSGKSLVFCKNCGTVMQSNPYTCEKCGEPLAGNSGGIPLFRNPDLLSEGMEDIGEDMDLSEMLGIDGSPLDDEMDDEAAKMFGNPVELDSFSDEEEIENQFSRADLEMLNMQMSKYSKSTSSEMPMVGRDMPEPEPPKPPQPPKPVDKDAPIIAEEQFIPESGDFGDFGDFTEEPSPITNVSVEPMQLKAPSPKPGRYPEPKPVYPEPKSVYPEPNPVDLDKPRSVYPEPSPEVPKPVYPEPGRYSEPKPIPESPVIRETPVIEEAPVIEETPESTPATPVNPIDDRDDYFLQPEELPPPEKHMPKYLYFGIIIIVLCITMGIILANVK